MVCLASMDTRVLSATGMALLFPAGPLPAPLLVLCPSHAELGHWLYHLEKQMALVGGLQRCHSAPPQVSAGNPVAPVPSLSACP